MLTTILDFSITLATYLIVIMGCLVTTCLLLYPVYFLLNNVLYNHTKASIYFISYIKNRKEFIKWHKENKPNVYTPNIKE